MVIFQDFDKFIIDEATKQGVQLFLKELERDKYSVCCGAFTEVSLSSTVRRIKGFISSWGFSIY
jgi:hypothetical protein